MCFETVAVLRRTYACEVNVPLSDHVFFIDRSLLLSSWSWHLTRRIEGNKSTVRYVRKSLTEISLDILPK